MRAPMTCLAHSGTCGRYTSSEATRRSPRTLLARGDAGGQRLPWPTCRLRARIAPIRSLFFEDRALDRSPVDVPLGMTVRAERARLRMGARGRARPRDRAGVAALRIRERRMTGESERTQHDSNEYSHFCSLLGAARSSKPPCYGKRPQPLACPQESS